MILIQEIVFEEMCEGINLQFNFKQLLLIIVNIDI